MNNFNPFFFNYSLIYRFWRISSRYKRKMRQRIAAASAGLLRPEGLAVGALVLGGVGLVGAHQNPVQGAVVLGVAVVSAGLDGAFNALVCMTVHNFFPPFVWYGLSMAEKQVFMQEFFDRWPILWYVVLEN